jgi:hypothetical protein
MLIKNNSKYGASLRFWPNPHRTEYEKKKRKKRKEGIKEKKKRGKKKSNEQKEKSDILSNGYLSATQSFSINTQMPSKVR